MKITGPLFRRWTGGFLCAALLGGDLLAAENAADTASTTTLVTNAFLSVQRPPRRAAWQQRLTLGPGDLLNLSILDRPETVHNEVPITPDGRITFLQAR